MELSVSAKQFSRLVLISLGGFRDSKMGESVYQVYNMTDFIKKPRYKNNNKADYCLIWHIEEGSQYFKIYYETKLRVYQLY